MASSDDDEEDLDGVSFQDVLDVVLAIFAIIMFVWVVIAKLSRWT